MMNIGVSSASFYPLSPYDAIEKLLCLDINTTEIFFNTVSELSVSFLEPLKKRLDDSGIGIKSIHPFTSSMESFCLFSEYYPRFEDTLEFYKRYFETANYLGSSIIVIHGDRCTNKIEDNEYFDRFGKLAELGKKQGVIVAQENVHCFRSQSPEFMKKMKRYLDDVSFVFDVKQSVRAGYDPYEFCDILGKNIVHFHINDFTKENDCVLPCTGDMDYKKLYSILKSNGFKGDSMIEVYRWSYKDENEIAESLEKLRRVI